MKVLDEYSDLNHLSEKRIPHKVKRYIVQEWLQFYNAFSLEGRVEDFDMSRHCRMVLLETSEDDIELIGLSSNLVDCTVEYVELVTFEESVLMYRTFILNDNESGIMLYSIVGTLGYETESFLAERAE
ncbi:hypothetical protein [Sporosarcina sp. ZBG7A]|uniref:hypothetical protein n=1 Tax=Sporosarcina sp. ZBG7A TaxID=1582223 RepID=UPI000579D002|nr:hypothetical protein [Sporosarcina sp. ZBG7A]